MKTIYHQVLGEVVLHSQHTNEGKTLTLVSDEFHMLSNSKRIQYKEWDIKTYISSKEKHRAVYWIIWGNIKDDMAGHGLTPLIHPSGRPVIRNTAIKRFLEMTKELPYINFSKV